VTYFSKTFCGTRRPVAVAVLSSGVKLKLEEILLQYWSSISLSHEEHLANLFSAALLYSQEQPLNDA